MLRVYSCAARAGKENRAPRLTVVMAAACAEPDLATGTLVSRQIGTMGGEAFRRRVQKGGRRDDADRAAGRGGARIPQVAAGLSSAIHLTICQSLEIPLAPSKIPLRKWSAGLMMRTTPRKTFDTFQVEEGLCAEFSVRRCF